MKNRYFFSAAIMALVSLMPVVAPGANVTSKTRWLFGYNSTVENSFDKLWSTSQVTAQPAKYGTLDGTVDDLTITTRQTYETGRYIHEEDCLYYYKYVTYTFTIEEPGELTIDALSMSDYKADTYPTVNTKDRKVSVSAGSFSGTITAFGGTRATASLQITGITAPTVVTVQSPDPLNWYSMQFTPASAPKEDLTMALTADDTSLVVDEQTQLRPVFTNASGNTVTIPANQLTYTVTNADDSSTEYATVDSNGLVTAVGAYANSSSSSVDVTVSFPGNSDYNAVEQTVRLTITKIPLTADITLSGNFIEQGDILRIESVVYKDPEGDEVDLGYNSTTDGTVLRRISQAQIEGATIGIGTLIIGSKPSTRYAYLRRDFSITVLPAIKVPEVKRLNPDGAELSTLSGTAMGLLTTPTYYNLKDIFGGFVDGNRVYGADISFTVENLTLDGTNIYSTTPTVNGVVNIKYNMYADSSHNVAINDITPNTGSPTYDSSTSTITFSGSGDRIGWDFTDFDNSPYKMFQVEIEPCDKSMLIAAEYSDGSYNYKSIPAGSRALYIPISPQKTLTRINLEMGQSGTLTFVPNSAVLKDTDYAVGFGSITGIIVSEPEKTQLDMTVSPTSVTLDWGTTTATGITTTYKEADTDTDVNGMTTTYTSANTAIATVAADGRVTGVKPGTTTITVATAGNDVYAAASKTVTVTVTKRTLTMTITPATATIKQAQTANFAVAYTYGGSPMADIATVYTTGSGIISADGSGYNVTVTAMKSGSTTLTASFAGDDYYNAVDASATVTVTDNPLFDYMGEELSGNMTGTLKNDSDEDQLYWKFGAPENQDMWVFKLNTSTDRYEFRNDKLKLKSDVHNSENAMDGFKKTRLTANGGGGDAFLEYNGMIGGYGTENGGRYLTPISGTFIRVEPRYNGVVTLRVRHNGGIDSGDSPNPEDLAEGKTLQLRCARRPLFVLDENGVIMPRTTTYNTSTGTINGELSAIDGTYARISATSRINDRFNRVNDHYSTWFTDPTAAKSVELQLGTALNQDFSKNAFYFTRNVIYGYADADSAAFRTGVRAGTVQRLFYSSDDWHVTGYRAPGVATSTNFFAKYGYEVVSASHLTISFPVKAGKTYFVGANKSKVALCTIEFLPTTTTVAASVTLDENASTTPSWMTSQNTGDILNVTLTRSFTKGYWHPIILPFSVSETQLKDIFGDDVCVLALDGALKMLSSKNNYATRDNNLNNTGQGDFNGMQIKNPAVMNASVTFTRHYYQMIYANCPVFICPSKNVSNPTFNRVTYVRPVFSGDEVVFPYTIDHEVGDGVDYNYRMVAMYHATTASQNNSREMYYISNSGGSKNVATLYHADPGSAPAMKGMRVWLEPKAGQKSAPLRYINMSTFDGDVVDDTETSAIESVIADQPDEVLMTDPRVFDVMGRVVGEGSLDGLAPGIYIFRGHKYIIK